jgi:acyl carrier protein
MERVQLLRQFEEIVEVPSGSLNGNEPLETLEQWDSLAMMSFIALASEQGNSSLSPRELAKCATVDDLLGMAGAPKS